MREIKIDIPKLDGDSPDLIKTDQEEVQFLWEVLKDIEPWNMWQRLPLKIKGNKFILMLDAGDQAYPEEETTQ